MMNTRADLSSTAASSRRTLFPCIQTSWGDAMNRNQQATPVDEGVDPSNEKIVLDQIKVPTEEKKPLRNNRGTSESNSEK